MFSDIQNLYSFFPPVLLKKKPSHASPPLHAPKSSLPSVFSAILEKFPAHAEHRLEARPSVSMTKGTNILSSANRHSHFRLLHLRNTIGRGLRCNPDHPTDRIVTPCYLSSKRSRHNNFIFFFRQAGTIEQR